MGRLLFRLILGRFAFRLNVDIDAFDIGVFFGPKLAKPVNVMGDDPVPHEPGGNGNFDFPVLDPSDGHRFEPALVSGFPAFRPKKA